MQPSSCLEEGGSPAAIRVPGSDLAVPISSDGRAPAVKSPSQWSTHNIISNVSCCKSVSGRDEL